MAMANRECLKRDRQRLAGCSSNNILKIVALINILCTFFDLIICQHNIDNNNNNNNQDSEQEQQHGDITVTSAIFVAEREEPLSLFGGGGNKKTNDLTHLTQFDDHIVDDQQKNSVNLFEKKFEDENTNSLRPALLQGGGGGEREENQMSSDELNATNLINQGGQFSAPIIELNKEFLKFFEELWRLKNNSANSLIRLEYFNSQAADNKRRRNNNNNKARNRTATQARQPTTFNNNNNNNNWLQFKLNKVNQSQGGNNNNNRTTNYSYNYNNNKPYSYNNQQQQQQQPIKQYQSQFSFQPQSFSVNSQLKGNQSFASVVGVRFNNWLLQLNQKINKAMVALTAPLMNKLSSSTLASSAREGANFETASLISIDDDDEKMHGRSSDDQQAASDVKVVENLLSLKQQKEDQRKQNLRIKRQVISGNDLNCVELESNQLNKCKSTEVLVNTNLNNSFPGTLMAIEDNCRHITFLLGNCWPGQLQQIKNSLTTWNESLLSLTDFPLPNGNSVGNLISINSNLRQPNNNNNNYNSEASSLISCGSSPKLESFVLERISWMWINLCMDKKFRQDYVENLKCLSLWTEERARLVCRNEFGRMHTKLNSAVATVAATSSSEQTQTKFSNDNNGPEPLSAMQLISESGDTTRKTLFVSSSNSDLDQPEQQQQQQLMKTSQQQSGQQQQQQQERQIREWLPDVIDRELESKLLCCMFDVFLRCVHRQAIRDCGRIGGQFVVNFMSRIGTDDLKYMCNSESRNFAANNRKQQQQQQQQHQHQHQHQHQQGRRSGGFMAGSLLPTGASSSAAAAQVILERGPFIEGNYCADPRIYPAIYGAHTQGTPSIAGGDVLSAVGDVGGGNTGLSGPNRDRNRGNTIGNVGVGGGTNYKQTTTINNNGQRINNNNNRGGNSNYDSNNGYLGSNVDLMSPDSSSNSASTFVCRLHFPGTIFLLMMVASLISLQQPCI